MSEERASLQAQDPEAQPAPSHEVTPDERRARLVAHLRATGALHDAAVARAMSHVPRHLFLPGETLQRAYADDAIATHWAEQVPISAASQPSIVAIMLQQLRLAPGMRVLEIGAGTGYNAALLAELVGPHGRVTTVDLDEEIAWEARERLTAAGYPWVEVVAADGGAGWPPSAPFDRIELTVGADDITPAWFDQLTDGGVLVLPLWLRTVDVSVAFRREGNVLVGESMTPCGFMHLRGGEAGAARWVSLGNGWHLSGEQVEQIADPVAHLLATRPRRRLWAHPTHELIQFIGVQAQYPIALWPDPARIRRRRPRGRYGLYAEGPDGPSLGLFSPSLPLLLSFGGGAAEQALDALTRQWQTAGTPPIHDWRLSAYPRFVGEVPPPGEGALRITRRHFVFDLRVMPS